MFGGGIAVEGDNSEDVDGDAADGIGPVIVIGTAANGLVV